tara:strand:- start:6345 stop:6971 length:627 start_codon:yes stop_codon:yes gene_type:complete
MSISKKLWSQNLDLANSSLNSLFIKGIAKGDLPIENFKSYIAQDSFFLEAFARAYGMAIAKSPDKKSLAILSKLLNGVIEELHLHESYLKKWEVRSETISLNLATEKYTNFLKEISQQKSMIEIISAMTPCMRLYSWLGKSLQSKYQFSSNPYKEWVNAYSDLNFENLANSLEEIIDSNYQKNNLIEIESLYKKAMGLELKFFEAYSP